MKRREQALLFLRKAAQDESLLDAVLELDSVSDEVIGFHCQPGCGEDVEGVAVRLGHHVPQDPRIGRLDGFWHVRAHRCRASLRTSTRSRRFGAVYRYDDNDGRESLNRAKTRALLRSLRAWAEDSLRSRLVRNPNESSRPSPE